MICRRVAPVAAIDSQGWGSARSIASANKRPNMPMVEKIRVTALAKGPIPKAIRRIMRMKIAVMARSTAMAPRTAKRMPGCGVVFEAASSPASRPTRHPPMVPMVATANVSRTDAQICRSCKTAMFGGNIRSARSAIWWNCVNNPSGLTSSAAIRIKRARAIPLIKNHRRRAFRDGSS